MPVPIVTPDLQTFLNTALTSNTKLSVSIDDKTNSRQLQLVLPDVEHLEVLLIAAVIVCFDRVPAWAIEVSALLRKKAVEGKIGGETESSFHPSASSPALQTSVPNEAPHKPRFRQTRSWQVNADRTQVASAPYYGMDRWREARRPWRT